MLLTIMLLIPLVGSIVLFLLPASKPTLAKQVALGFALITLAVSLVVVAGLDNSTGLLQYVESYEWIAAFGISWTLGVNGISASLIVMSTILVPVAMIAGWWDAENATRGTAKGYFSLILILESCIIGAFAANDLFLFYVFLRQCYSQFIF